MNKIFYFDYLWNHVNCKLFENSRLLRDTWGYVKLLTHFISWWELRELVELRGLLSLRSNNAWRVILEDNIIFLILDLLRTEYNLLKVLLSPRWLNSGMFVPRNGVMRVSDSHVRISLGRKLIVSKRNCARSGHKNLRCLELICSALLHAKRFLFLLQNLLLCHSGWLTCGERMLHLYLIQFS